VAKEGTIGVEAGGVDRLLDGRGDGNEGALAGEVGEGPGAVERRRGNKVTGGVERERHHLGTAVGLHLASGRISRNLILLAL